MLGYVSGWLVVVVFGVFASHRLDRVFRQGLAFVIVFVLVCDSD